MTESTDEAIIVVASFHPRQSSRAQLARELGQLAEVADRNPGCNEFRVMQDIEEPRRILAIEAWTSVAVHDAHLASDTVQTFLARVRDMLDSPIAVTRAVVIA